MAKLKNLTEMSPSERQVYNSRVAAWYETEDIDEGLLLLTALPQAATFLSYAGCYPHDQKIKEIHKYLKSIAPAPAVKKPQQAKVHDTRPHQAKAQQQESESSQLQAGPFKAEDNNQPVAGCYTTPAGSKFYYNTEGEVTSVGGPRPNHYDEWKNLMPEELRDKVETIQENYANMVYWRREVERLAADPRHSEADLSRAARLTRNYEALNLNIFAQADLCWEELSGKIVSDDTKREVMEEERKLIRETNKDILAKEEKTQQPDEAAQPEPVEDKPAETISADQAQKYIRDKIDPATATEAQKQKAFDYAEIILKEKGKLSKKVKEKLDLLGYKQEN